MGCLSWEWRCCSLWRDFGASISLTKHRRVLLDISSAYRWYNCRTRARSGPLASFVFAAADRWAWRKRMDLESLSSGILYLLVSWGVLTGILLILVIYRSQLSNHEEDQLFLDRAEEGMAAEQRVIVARIEGLGRPIAVLCWLSGILLVALGSVFVWHAIRSF